MKVVRDADGKLQFAASMYPQQISRIFDVSPTVAYEEALEFIQREELPWIVDTGLDDYLNILEALEL
jgi:hypothetical protein